MDAEKNPGCIYSTVQYLAGTGIYCWLFLELALKLDLATVAGGHAQTSGIGPIYLFINLFIYWTRNRDIRVLYCTLLLASKQRSCFLLELHPHPHPHSPFPPQRLPRRRPPRCRALAELPMQNCHRRIAICTAFVCVLYSQ